MIISKLYIYNLYITIINKVSNSGCFKRWWQKHKAQWTIAGNQIWPGYLNNLMKTKNERLLIQNSFMFGRTITNGRSFLSYIVQKVNCIALYKRQILWTDKKGKWETLLIGWMSFEKRFWPSPPTSSSEFCVCVNLSSWDTVLSLVLLSDKAPSYLKSCAE